MPNIDPIPLPCGPLRYHQTHYIVVFLLQPHNLVQKTGRKDHFEIVYTTLFSQVCPKNYTKKVGQITIDLLAGHINL